jgi:hypothetical protein
MRVTVLHGVNCMVSACASSACDGVASLQQCGLFGCSRGHFCGTTYTARGSVPLPAASGCTSRASASAPSDPRTSRAAARRSRTAHRTRARGGPSCCTPDHDEEGDDVAPPVAGWRRTKQTRKQANKQTNKQTNKALSTTWERIGSVGRSRAVGTCCRMRRVTCAAQPQWYLRWQ